MTITIFILFILYTIGCCLDGPDLKPKWKKWLGGKLERDGKQSEAKYVGKGHDNNINS